MSLILFIQGSIRDLRSRVAIVCHSWKIHEQSRHRPTRVRQFALWNLLLLWVVVLLKVIAQILWLQVSISNRLKLLTNDKEKIQSYFEFYIDGITDSLYSTLSFNNTRSY